MKSWRVTRMNDKVTVIVQAFADIADWCYDASLNMDSRAKHLADQMMRAADSIGANICEGYGREYAGSMRQFYGYARGSAMETCWWLDRAISRKLVPMQDGMPMLSRLRESLTQLEGLIGDLPRRDK